jgi:hypothetical protein
VNDLFWQLQLWVNLGTPMKRMVLPQAYVKERKQVIRVDFYFPVKSWGDNSKPQEWNTCFLHSKQAKCCLSFGLGIPVLFLQKYFTLLGPVWNEGMENRGMEKKRRNMGPMFWQNRGMERKT